MEEKVTQFEEIQVRRIKVVADDGTVRMLLAAPPLPAGTLRGKPIAEQNRGEEAGILFYTEEGTECGGLGFRGKTGDDGIDADAGFSFDHYEQDEAISIDFSQQGSQRGYGISMMDRPLSSIAESVEALAKVDQMAEGDEKQQALKKAKEGHAQRLFVGRLPDGQVVLYMMDSKGRPRIRIGIDEHDEPRMEFLDESGGVTYSAVPSL